MTMQNELWAHAGGMGAMAPMGTQRSRVWAFHRVYGPMPAADLPSRIDKQKTLASAANTPRVMTNIQEANADDFDCRS